MDLAKKFVNGDDVFSDIKGQEDVKTQVKSALVTNRHIIIVGPPGVGKTTLAKNVAKLLGKEENFVRVQGSPDLTVEDLLGDIDPIKALKYGPLSMEAFSKGKIFKADNGVLFFDELNRCPEKLQNALLQVLEEGTATIGSYDVDFDIDFVFIGTMNPQDSSTEALSEVLLDRFDLVYMSYPETAEIEKEIVVESGAKLDVEFPEQELMFSINFVRALREDSNLERLPSVRASLGLYERAMSNALLAGKKSVERNHILEALVSVLSHRIKLKPSVKYLKDPSDYIEEQIKKFLDKDVTEDSGDSP